MDLTIHNVRIDTTGQIADVGVSNGKIVNVDSNGLGQGGEAINGDGAMLSPAFIDPHFHLENALLWDVPNHSGTLREAIDNYAKIKRNLDTRDIIHRATIAIHEALSNGTLFIRNHVDIDQVAKLRLLEGIVETRKRFEGVMDIQIVAFPQMGLAKNHEATDLMWQAMESGADIVGGMPHGEQDMYDAARHIEVAFEIAKKNNADIDMHIDETDDPYWRTLELLADKTIEEGYQGRVTAGHCCAMAAWDDKLAARVIDKVHRAKINIITNTPVNLLLQGRGDQQPVRRGITRVRELVEAGVNVACGQDDLMNMFYPFGQMDMLEVANFVAHAAHFSTPTLIEEAFNMPRYNAAKVLRLSGYGIKEGADANLVLIDAVSALDAVRRQPVRQYVIRKGDILVRNERKTILSSKIPN